MWSGWDKEVYLLFGKMLIAAAVILFVILVAWFLSDFLGSYDHSSDTHIREVSEKMYMSGSLPPDDFRRIAPKMRNPTAGDHFRDGAILLRPLMSDGGDKDTAKRVQLEVVRAFVAALRGLKNGEVAREFTEAFVVGKVLQARLVLLDDTAHAKTLDPFIREVPTTTKIISDPFNVADSNVVDHTGRCMRQLLSTFRFESNSKKAECLNEALRRASKKSAWALRTMAAHPTSLPVGLDSETSDAEIFACAWMWSDRMVFFQDEIKSSLVSCLEEVVTDKLDWESGVLCRIAHMVQALAGIGDDEDEQITRGAVTFQIHS